MPPRRRVARGPRGVAVLRRGGGARARPRGRKKGKWSDEARAAASARWHARSNAWKNRARDILNAGRAIRAQNKNRGKVPGRPPPLPRRANRPPPPIPPRAPRGIWENQNGVTVGEENRREVLVRGGALGNAPGHEAGWEGLQFADADPDVQMERGQRRGAEDMAVGARPERFQRIG